MNDYSTPDFNIWPYLSLAISLKDKKRKGVGTMFRHQLETFTILLEYGYSNRILLKASILHDYIEDGTDSRNVLQQRIRQLDSDGKEVLHLVNEMTIREDQGVEEPKSEFLTRIMTSGSDLARILKLADRISNVASLAVTNDIEFIKRYLNETKTFILPYAEGINAEMSRELNDLVELKSTILAKTTSE